MARWTQLKDRTMATINDYGVRGKPFSRGHGLSACPSAGFVFITKAILCSYFLIVTTLSCYTLLPLLVYQCIKF